MHLDARAVDHELIGVTLRAGEGCKESNWSDGSTIYCCLRGGHHTYDRQWRGGACSAQCCCWRRCAPCMRWTTTQSWGYRAMPTSRCVLSSAVHPRLPCLRPSTRHQHNTPKTPHQACTHDMCARGPRVAGDQEGVQKAIDEIPPRQEQGPGCQVSPHARRPAVRRADVQRVCCGALTFECVTPAPSSARSPLRTRS